MFTRALVGDSVDPDTEKALDEINIGTANEGDSQYVGYSEYTEGIKDDPNPNQADWEQRVKNKGSDVKTQMSQRVDEATELAIKVIKQLPSVAQDAAADCYTTGLDVVMVFFNKVWECIQKVINAIAEFFKGVWTALTNAWTAVKGGFDAVISWFTRGFNMKSTSNGLGTTLPLHTSLSKVKDAIQPFLNSVENPEGGNNTIAIRKSAVGWRINLT